MTDDRIRKFRKMLAQAPNYEVWKAAALELDFLEGNAEWKEDFVSDLYHYELIYDRLSNLRQYRQQNDFERLKRALREGLHHDLGNMGNPALYTESPDKAALYAKQKALREKKLEEIEAEWMEAMEQLEAAEA